VASKGGHIGATWRIRLNLSFLRPTRVHITNGKPIGSAIFAQLTAECRRACQGTSFPLVIAPLRGGTMGSHLIHASLGPSKSITQTASRSVQHRFCSVHVRVSSDMSWRAFSPQDCQIAPSDAGSVSLSSTWLRGSTQLSIPNGISIGSDVFAQLTA